ncbi:unnamed protein product [Somion occarium]|uniref:Uncharacterized protein n=1 Tax=Somion occarium TaxID=3059160 RepID=A0ABP1E0F3_9APHY
MVMQIDMRNLPTPMNPGLNQLPDIRPSFFTLRTNDVVKYVAYTAMEAKQTTFWANVAAPAGIITTSHIAARTVGHRTGNSSATAIVSILLAQSEVSMVFPRAPNIQTTLNPTSVIRLAYNPYNPFAGILFFNT